MERAYNWRSQVTSKEKVMKALNRLVLLLGVFSLAGINAFGDSTRFSGQATVVRANVLGTDLVLSDTGALPPSGGAKDATLLEYPIAGVPDPLGGAWQAQVLHAATVGQGNESHSEASVANVNLSVAGNTVSAGFLMANADAGCHGGDAFVSGSSQIAQLVINGQA